MKKQLNTSPIINELSGNSAFFRQKKDTKEQKKVSVGEASDKPTAQPTGKPANQKTEQLPERSDGQPAAQTSSQAADQSSSESTHRPTKQPVDQSIDRSTGRSIDDSAILGKPKAFYISEKQDKDLNRAVELLSNELNGKINQKIDRSTIVRLILEKSQITKKESIMQMADQLVSQLVNRLTSR
jgi:hypothetical protein